MCIIDMMTFTCERKKKGTENRKENSKEKKSENKQK